MFKKAIILMIILTSFGSLLFANDKNNITISGSTTVLPISQRAAEAYMDKNTDINISVSGGGSGVGIAAIIDGKIDIADSSRPITKEEIAQAKKNGHNIIETTIAKDGIAVIVNPEIYGKVTDLSLEQLKNIYIGKIKNWKEIGGPDKDIIVVSRDTSSGTFEVFNEKVLEKKEKVRKDALMTASNKEVVTTVAQTPGAIGYVGIGYLSEDIKALKIAGVMPTAQTVHNQTYKISRSLYMYTDGKPKGNIKKFIDFILSHAGQKLVLEEGFITLN